MQKGFWQEIDKPIVGLSPMDGVTDAPMRFIAKKYGLADILYTEFVSAEGLWRIKKRGEMDNKIWHDLRFDKTQGPNIAQIFGSDPESFYEAAKIICELGFDGIDINMGCPSPGLEKRGGGAGLIRDKCNAVEVVEATRRGVKDFFSAPQSTQNSCSDPTSLRLRGPLARDFGASDSLENKNTDAIPVSLKTRIGSDKPDKKWWELLASLQMPAVAMHGRTFKQLYSGFADWDLLLEASEIIRESGAVFLGNGDVSQIFVDQETVHFVDPDASTLPSSEVLPVSKLDNLLDGTRKFIVETRGGRRLDLTGMMDGVLVGRGAIGNPWILDKNQNSKNQNVEVSERLRVAVEHARKFEETLPEQKFFVMRKHLVGYASGFDNATDLRKKLVMTNSAEEVDLACREWLSE